MPDQAKGRGGKSSAPLLPVPITSLVMSGLSIKIERKFDDQLAPLSQLALHFTPCSVAPQHGQALTSTSKGADPTGSSLQRVRRVASRADVDSDRGLTGAR